MLALKLVKIANSQAEPTVFGVLQQCEQVYLSRDGELSYVGPQLHDLR